MSKNHGQKQTVGWRLAGAVVGGLVLYGAMRLGRSLLASPRVQRLAQYVGEIFDSAGGSVHRPADAETLFQAEAAGAPEPPWVPGSRRPSLYGPN